ncbi:MAG: 2-amino-4-hydroxy-6-hydroxymethyldihydropteridine diphosphokinase [Chloroflexota bacterium]
MTQNSNKKSQVAIALGSNLGDSLANLENAVTLLDQTDGIRLLQCSSWYRSKAMGPPQPDYLNGCVVFETTLTPQALLARLQAIEHQFHRTRSIHWGPRTLDLDLVLFDDLVLKDPVLTIPHPGLPERSFVLAPLAEIAPGWIDPISGETITDLLQKVDCSDLLEIKPSRKTTATDKKQDTPHVQ